LFYLKLLSDSFYNCRVILALDYFSRIFFGNRFEFRFVFRVTFNLGQYQLAFDMVLMGKIGNSNDVN